MNIFLDLSNFTKNTIYAKLAHEHAETPTRAMKGGSVSSALMLAFADPMKAKLVDSIPVAPAARYCQTADKKPEIAIALSRN